MKSLLSLGLCVFLVACDGAQAGPGGTPDLAVSSTPVDIEPGMLDGLKLLGATELDADHRAFGGFSGLHMDDGRLIAVSDIGWWLLADIDYSAGALQLGSTGFTQMRGEGGETFDKKGGDAEGLTLRDGNILVSFERDHRVMAHIQDGQLGEPIHDRAFEALGTNKGLEALATTPEGWLLLFAEQHHERQFKVFLIRRSGKIEQRTLPAISRHYATGADIGPDGRLYLLLRDYAPLTGVSILIERFDLDEDGWPVAKSRKLMARFDTDSGIDNMEGISLWKDASGKTHLTLISDDNFRSLQRTLLVDFEITGP